MVTFLFFFFGLALCLFAGVVCLALAKSMKGTPHEHLSADDRLAWYQIKAAMRDLYSRYEIRETPLQHSLRSWAGTLVICAGLCLIGIVLEVEYDQRISVDNIFSGLTGEHPVSTCRAPYRMARPHKFPVHEAKPSASPSEHPAQPAQPAEKQPETK